MKILENIGDNYKKNKIETFYKKIDKKTDACRYFYYYDIYNFLKTLNLNRNIKIVEFGSYSNEIIKATLEILNCKNYHHLKYPKYDILNLNNLNEKFDLVILDTILEHLKNPFLAASEIFNVLNYSGILIATSALLYPVHYIDKQNKGDYFRFTVDGLKEVFKDYQIDLLKTYGDLYFVQYMAQNGYFENGRSGGFINNKPENIYKLRLLKDNDEDFAVTNMLIARKINEKK